ncbi:DENND6A [Symbiodinium sp. CCMP2592]|nr:DENND6A [Symbiodinium sp. CCMP2592]
MCIVLCSQDPTQGPATSTVWGLTGEKLQAFRQWTCCFCVCVFDLEQGQRLELETPGDSPLSEEDRQLLRYLAFPDSGPSRLTSVETAVFPFRFRRGSGVSRGRRSASRDLPLKDDFWYAAAYFQQQPDEASKRHCVQRSLVVVSQHGFLAFWAALVTEVGKHFQERGPDVLEEVVSAIASWPSPPAGLEGATPLQLPLLGGVLEFLPMVPIRSTPADGSLVTAAPVVPEPAYQWSSLACTGAWSARLSGNAQALQQKRAGEAQAAAWASVATEELTFVAKSLGLTGEMPRGSPMPWKPYTAFATLADCLWLLWESALCGEPLMIFSPDYPTKVAEAVLAVASLISPVEYSGDFRPYFTIYDGDFEHYRQHVQSNGASSKAVVFGVTNPVMLQLLADFPISVLLQPRHREDASTQSPLPAPAASQEVLVESPTGDRLQRARRVPASGRGYAQPELPQTGLGVLDADAELLQRIKASDCVDQDDTVLRYFYELTLAFLRPFLPHLEALTGAAGGATFDVSSFLASLQPVGPFSQISRNDCQNLYSRFIRGVNFKPWLAKQVSTFPRPREDASPADAAMAGVSASTLAAPPDRRSLPEGLGDSSPSESTALQKKKSPTTCDAVADSAHWSFPDLSGIRSLVVMALDVARRLAWQQCR